MKIIQHLLSQVEKKLAGRNDATKRSYLRKFGCKVGETTRFSGPLPDIGEPYLLEIGENCLISGNVHFFTHDGGVKVLNSLNYFGGKMMDKMGRIKIGNNVFIGNGAAITMGVSIGDNCIIGAHSVGTKSIPSNSVVAGMPAKVICSIDEYFEKNKARGVFYETPSLSAKEKEDYLRANVPLI